MISEKYSVQCNCSTENQSGKASRSGKGEKLVRGVNIFHGEIPSGEKETATEARIPTCPVYVSKEFASWAASNCTHMIYFDEKTRKGVFP